MHQRRFESFQRIYLWNETTSAHEFWFGKYPTAVDANESKSSTRCGKDGEFA